MRIVLVETLQGGGHDDDLLVGVEAPHLEVLELYGKGVRPHGINEIDEAIAEVRPVAAIHRKIEEVKVLLHLKTSVAQLL